MNIKTDQKLMKKRSCIVGNMKEICGICLDSGELELLANSNVFPTYKILLYSLNLRSDFILPKNICNYCTNELERITNFISKLKVSTGYLMKAQEKEPEPISDGKVEHYETFVNKREPDDNDKTNGEFETLIVESDDSNHPNTEIEEDSIDDVELSKVQMNSTKAMLQTLIQNAKSFKIPAFVCNICNQGFISQESLDSHIPLHTQNDSDVEEVIKFEVERKPEIYKPYLCNICNKGFVYEISWRYHMTSHGQESLYECMYCDWTGMREIELNNHLKDHYQKYGNSGDEEGDHEYACLVCGEHYGNTRSLQEHLKTHEKKHECKHCGLSFKMKRTLMKHLHLHNDEGIFDCNICGKILTRKIFLKRHMELVHIKGQVKKPEPIYFCPTCNKGFFFMKNLNKHEELHKENPNGTQEPRACSCEHCGKTFTYRANLLRHIKITHAGVKKFSCGICKEKFTVKNSLLYHMNIHTDAKPYQCEICSRAFRQPSALIRHKTHVHQTTEKNFKCDLCDKLLKSNVSLKAHMKRHMEA